MSETLSVDIHPSAVVDPKAQLGEGVQIGPLCIVGPHAQISDGVQLISSVTVMGHTSVGPRTVVYPYTVLGAPPQDMKYKGEDTTLIIGADNTIREHATMHIGTGVGRGETRVGDGGLYMVGAHIGHDSLVGDGVVFANNATLGGSVYVGEKAYLGGLSAVHQHCRLGRHAFIGGGAPVTGDVIPYGMVDNHGDLAGLNLVGLKRRGFERDTIHDMRTAYRLFFAAEGAFQERVEDVARLFSASDEVMEIVAFIREPSNRPLCTPGGRNS